jgi:hypothetical protein
MNPAETYELREAVRAVLDRHGLLDNVQLEFDLMLEFSKYIRSDVRQDVRPSDRKQATLDALVKGMGKNAQMEADWTRLFQTTPNWKTKTASELMVWLKERADHGEMLDQFADWWFRNDWRGKQGAPPSINLVREMWGLAFSDGSQRQQKDSRSTSLPEGL